MKRVKLFILLLVVCQAVISQTGLVVQGTTPNLHLLHTVAAKENWYSIGRLYNLSPKELAPYNQTSLDKPLSIGQQIRIPLTGVNFSQNGSKAADEIFVPLYHIVQEKEGMYRVSINHNKVSADNLKRWNNLSSDQLNNGMKLIVGYLKVKEGQSALASSGSGTVSATEPAVAKKQAVTPAKAETKTTPAQPEATRREDVAIKKEEVEPVAETPAPRAIEVKNTGAPASHNGGFFRSQFSESGKSTTGNAGTFKSTSGWEDGKYYALMNNVPIGTIVKISFSSTNKSVYAKVLGQLPEMRESAGLSVRLSDAAASELGVSISKFYVDVKY